MKPSLKSIKAKMGTGGAIGKDHIARELQNMISNNSAHTPEFRGLITGILFVFSGKTFVDINHDINDLYDEMKK